MSAVLDEVEDLVERPLAQADAVVASALARAMAPRKDLSVSQWADAHREVSTKQSSKAGKWRTANNPPLAEPMDCMSARHTARDVVLKFPIQFGKALAIDTPIATPQGWSTMGALAVGDQVFDEFGRITRVTHTSPVFDDHPCYRVTFSDGASILADAGHRWAVDNERHYHRIERQTLTTEHIANTFRPKRQNVYAIPLPLPLEGAAIHLPIDPYVLGIWLGDGGSATGQLTLNHDDAEFIVAKLRAAGHGCEVRKLASDQARGALCTNVLIDGRSSGAAATFHAQLSEAGLRGAKHIPQTYLRASRAQRLALLQGLMDTDGHAPARRGAMEISSSYPALAQGIVELLHTLGFKPTVAEKPTAGRLSYRISFTAYADEQPFSLPRKVARVQGREGRRVSEARRRRIVAVDRVETVPTRCIAVDSPNHLYLAGRALVPTHNTEIAINAVGYGMDHAPGPTMVALPGEVSMHKWVAQKLNPMLEETPVVRAVLSSTNSRDGANRREFKDFAGGQLFIEHAGSPARLKSTTVERLIVDELDEFAANLLSGDDPVKMLDGRTSAYPNTYKRLYISTPTMKGLSRIDELFDKGDQRHYHVPCPHCGEHQALKWAGLDWSRGAENVVYLCEHNGCVIREHHKTEMIAAGRWVPHNSGAKTRSYTINCLYYQFGLGPRWGTLVEEWLDAQADHAKLKTFVNDRLAEVWEDPAMRSVRHNAIADRSEPYPLRFAPEGVLAITAGVDTQDNRLAVHIIGWGPAMAFWVLDYVELPGDPAEGAVFAALTELLNRPIAHAWGGTLRIEAMCIDAGGHRTEDVKAFVAQRRVTRPLAIFGAVPNNAPILGKGKLQEVKGRNKSDRKGSIIHHVGTVAAKHWLYSRLSVDGGLKPEDHPKRSTHFSDQLERDYFSGLVGETFDPRKNRFEKKRGARNEPLDTWVYAYAAAHHPEVRLHRHTRADWEARATRLRAMAEAAGAPPTPASVPATTPIVRAAAATPRTGIASNDWSSRL